MMARSRISILYSSSYGLNDLAAPRGSQGPRLFRPHHSVCDVRVSVLQPQKYPRISKMRFDISSSQRAEYLKETCELLTPLCSGLFPSPLSVSPLSFSSSFSSSPRSQHLPPMPSLQGDRTLDTGHPGREQRSAHGTAWALPTQNRRERRGCLVCLSGAG